MRSLVSAPLVAPSRDFKAMIAFCLKKMKWRKSAKSEKDKEGKIQKTAYSDGLPLDSTLPSLARDFVSVFFASVCLSCVCV